MNGIIKLVTPKGFGFLRLEGETKDVYFHAKDLVKGLLFETLKSGDKVLVSRVDPNPVREGSIARGISLA